MSKGNEDPKGSGDGAGSPLFQAGQDGGGGGNRTALMAGGVVVLAILGYVGLRALRSEPPPPPPAPTGRPAPKPIEIPEGATVRIPGATFGLGSEDGDPDEKPVTQVTVAPFELDVTEVTVAAYTKCVTAGKCTAPDTGMYCNWKKDGRDNHPINCLDWNQASSYCAFVGKRLPTEDEWELAARGTDGRKRPWKDGEPGAQLCWNGEGSLPGRGHQQGTCPVASYPAGASQFGAYDMLGNVWEWTASPYCPYDNRGCTSDRRVIRGGAWNNVDPTYVRAADRAKEILTARPENVGVRCAKNPS